MNKMCLPEETSMTDGSYMQIGVCVKFIHIADVHLGMIPDAGYPWSNARAEEMWKTLGKVVKRCNQDQIDLLFIAGDLFHRQPLKKELKELNYLFSTLEKTKVVIIAGNHDCIREESYYKNYIWSEQVTLLQSEELERVYFEELDTEISGFSYHQSEIRDERYKDIIRGRRGRYQILIAHGGDEKHIPIDFFDLATKRFDYVALGHIHKPNLMPEKNMAYCGSLEPTDRNDLGERGYIQGEITEEGTKFSFVPASARVYISLRITIQPDTTEGALCEKLKETMESHGKENIYKITLDGSYDPEARLDLDKIQEIGNIIQIVDESSPEYDIDVLRKEHRDDVIGMYIEAFLQEPLTEERKKALYYGINALLWQGGR